MPALSSSQIVQMIKTPPSGVTAGRARFMAKQACDVPSHQAFANDMASLPAAQPDSVTHPEGMVRGQARATKELTPSDLVWLQRLPQEPADDPRQQRVVTPTRVQDRPSVHVAVRLA